MFGANNFERKKVMSTLFPFLFSVDLQIDIIEKFGIRYDNAVGIRHSAFASESVYLPTFFDSPIVEWFAT